LHEKGGKRLAMPCHHNLETYLQEYIDGVGLAKEPKAFLFQSYSRATGQLTGNPLPQANAYAMIQRRAKSAGVNTRAGNHAFRATGVTAYLKNGGSLEKASQMANHASTRRRSASFTSSYPAGDGRLKVWLGRLCFSLSRRCLTITVLVIPPTVWSDI
jgi:integrase